MLRHLIATILVFALLSYGSALAFAGHALEEADHAAGIHAHGQGALDEGDCDHCCHAATHMTGLAQPLLALQRPEGAILRPAPGPLVATRASSPPRKPPRS